MPSYVPSIYLMAISGSNFACRTLWQMRGSDAICISADADVAWMQGSSLANIIERCAKERLTLTFMDYTDE